MRWDQAAQCSAITCVGLMLLVVVNPDGSLDGWVVGWPGGWLAGWLGGWMRS